MTLRLSNSTLSPDLFAAVMGTVILSAAAKNHRYAGFSGALEAIAVLAMAVLVAAVLVTAAAKRRLLPWTMEDAETTMPLFTFVAACAVLGDRLSSSHPLALWVLGVVAASAWLALMALSVRNILGHGIVELRDRIHGVWLLASVATSALATVAARAASETGYRPWLIGAAALWTIALSLYVVLTVFMVWRAVAERLDQDGFEPDTWILMGALSIAVVSGHYLRNQVSPGWAGSVTGIMLLAWALATLWIPLLIYFGLHRVEQRPRLLRLTGSWWAVVFPLGMYSVATYQMADAVHVRALQTVALIAFWDAVLAWSIVAVAGLLRVPRAVRAVSEPHDHRSPAPAPRSSAPRAET